MHEPLSSKSSPHLLKWPLGDKIFSVRNLPEVFFGVLRFSECTLPVSLKDFGGFHNDSCICSSIRYIRLATADYLDQRTGICFLNFLFDQKQITLLGIEAFRFEAQTLNGPVQAALSR